MSKQRGCPFWKKCFAMVEHDAEFCRGDSWRFCKEACGRVEKGELKR